MPLNHADPFIARFVKLMDQRKSEVAEIIKSGIDMDDEVEYHINPQQQEVNK